MYKLRHGTQTCLVPIANKIRGKRFVRTDLTTERAGMQKNTTDLLGQAICDNPECHYKKDVIFWFYKT